MKRCTKCGIEKAASEFSKDKSRKDGLHPHCKGCMKLYQEANKERRREYHKLYRKANKERKNEYMKLYREANKEQMKLYREATKEMRREYDKLYNEANKERMKLYREANKERLSEYQKLYREANKERRNEQSRVYHAEESRLKDERYIAARIKNGYTREEAIILRGIYKSTKRGEQNRDTCDQLFMAGLI